MKQLQHTLTMTPYKRLVWDAGERQNQASARNRLKYSPIWQEYRMAAHDQALSSRQCVCLSAALRL